MKKLIIITLLLLSVSISAQREIKVNLLDALALKTLSASYEHYVSEQTSIGLSTLFNFESESSDFRYNEDRVFTVYTRHYFSTQSLWNFFGEVFFAYSLGDEEYTLGNTTLERDYSDGALGVAVGYKYVSPGGFTADIHGGMGRNFFHDHSPVIIPRVGVNVGWQF